jgi:DNA modification methylase
MSRSPVTDARLQSSRTLRESVLRRFGFVPTSMLNISRGALSRQMFMFQGEVPETRASIVLKQKRLELNLRQGVAAYSGSGKDRGPLSIMPAELVDFFVQYYSEEGDVYLDPFMGQGIQMQVALKRRRHYYGYDASSTFFAYVDRIREKLITPASSVDVRVYLGDSRSPDQIPDNVGDFSFHSPPYWDVEYYGDDDAQLGKAPTYHEFLALMRDVAEAWLPKFKSGAYHVVNVGDFRRDGTFYSYHSDLVREFVDAGWVMHDIWIIDGLVGGLMKIFAADCVKKRITPRCHEYALVFRAP